MPREDLREQSLTPDFPVARFVVSDVSLAHGTSRNPTAFDFDFGNS
jgi:hypothetical protein